MSAPVLRGAPLVSNLFRSGRDIFGLLEDARALGDVVEVKFPPFLPRMFLVSHPEAIEAVLLTEHAAFRKDAGTRMLERVTGQGLLVSDGAFWRRQRGLAQPAFRHERIVGYAKAMAELARARAQRWSGVVDLHREWMALTLEVVVKTLFGTALPEGAPDVGAALDEVMEYFLGFAGTGLPLPLAVPTPGNFRFRRAVKDIDALVYRFIAERRAEGEAAVAERTDLLSLLLSARDEEGRAMNERQLRDEAVTLVLAGHETTALALSWATWLLGRHPAAMAKLTAEVDAVLGERAAAYEDLARLRFTEAVIAEAMRLYPPAWIIGREPLRPVQVGGAELPPGAQVYLSPWLVHRDPRFFEAPGEFRPERWEKDLAKSLPRFAYFPFGGGPRICIGNAFAKMEAVVLLATAVQCARLELVDVEEPRRVASVTLRPGAPIRARVAPRPSPSRPHG